ncbi:MAG: RMD1 family protein [Chloroflexaceae bacterium]|nr:RMD1 family protein [Chloroflexaceae bacterium]
MQTLSIESEVIEVHGRIVGRSLNLKGLEKTACLAMEPLTVKAGQKGCAVLFRYGAVVFFGLTAEEEQEFLDKTLTPLINTPIAGESEEAKLRLDGMNPGKVEGEMISLSEFSLENFQIVADILGKSAILSYYENQSATAFDRIEPFATNLQHSRRSRQQVRELLRQLGNTLAIHHKMVGRVEIIDKPELLWEQPQLERFYRRLADEYEVRERHRVLERKLELVSRTAETAIGLLQYNTNLRVEWYIVILIVVEILLSLYQIFFRS